MLTNLADYHDLADEICKLLNQLDLFALSRVCKKISPITIPKLKQIHKFLTSEPASYDITNIITYSGVMTNLREDIFRIHLQSLQHWNGKAYPFLTEYNEDEYVYDLSRNLINTYVLPKLSGMTKLNNFDILQYERDHLAFYYNGKFLSYSQIYLDKLIENDLFQIPLRSILNIFDGWLYLSTESDLRRFITENGANEIKLEIPLREAKVIYIFNRTDMLATQFYIRFKENKIFHFIFGVWKDLPFRFR